MISTIFSQMIGHDLNFIRFFFNLNEVTYCPDLLVILYDPFCVVKLSGTIHDSNVKFSDDRLKLNKITFLFPKGTKRLSSLGRENLEWKFAKCYNVFICNFFFYEILFEYILMHNIGKKGCKWTKAIF